MERMEELGLMENDFLWEEEKKIAAMVLMNNEMGLAWAEMEKGRFREDYFSPVVFSVHRSSSLDWKKDRNWTEPNCKGPDHRLRLHKF